MTCKVSTDGHGSVKFECGPDPKPTDHECDLKGPTVEVPCMGGTVFSASCSVCGRTAFQFSEIW